MHSKIMQPNNDTCCELRQTVDKDIDKFLSAKN